MVKTQWLLIYVIIFSACNRQLTIQTTAISKLEKFVKKVGKNIEGMGDHWTFEFEDITILVIASKEFDRMRIISPIISLEDISSRIFLKLLEANFDKTLDARYAIWKNQVWSAFIHPLAELTEKEFFSGLHQVVGLKKNFGLSFSSSSLQFGNETEEGGEKKIKKSAPPAEKVPADSALKQPEPDRDGSI